MRNLLLSNITGKDNFILYTFNRELSIDQAVNYFRNFVKRRMRLPLKHYIWVAEVGASQINKYAFTGTYRPHIHAVHFGSNLKWSSKEELYELERSIAKEWKGGFVSIKTLESTPERLASYLSKYLVKSFADNPFASRWGKSDNLVKASSQKSDDTSGVKPLNRIYNFKHVGSQVGEYRKVLQFKS